MVDQTFLLELLLVVAAVKTIIISIIIWKVFKQDIQQWWGERGEQRAPRTAPICLYCQSAYTQPTDVGESRWDGNDLVLVTTYECQHCHLPFWHVERVETGALRP